MAVTVPFELDEDDYAEGILAGERILYAEGILARQRIMRRFQRWSRLVLVVVVTALAMLIIIDLLGQDTGLDHYLEALARKWFVIPPVLAAIGLLWLLEILSPGIRRKELRKQYRKRKSLHTPRTYRFDEEGLHASAENFSTYHPWNRFAKWAEDERFIFLSMQQLSFEIIPKRDLPSEEDLVELRALLTANVGPPAGSASSAKQAERA